MIARLLISELPSRITEINKVINMPKNHPDLLYYPQDYKLGISEARKIKEHFSLKPYSAKGRVVVLEDASNLTIEAQNALLKTLEEPPENAILILGATSDAKFLPTILSRCQIIRGKGEGERGKDYQKDVEKLISASIAERFEYVEKLKDREEFLKVLVDYFHHSQNTQFLRQLLKAEEWAAHNVNIRAILEYLMLVMPQNL